MNIQSGLATLLSDDEMERLRQVNPELYDTLMKLQDKKPKIRMNKVKPGDLVTDEEAASIQDLMAPSKRKVRIRGYSNAN